MSHVEKLTIDKIYQLELEPNKLALARNEIFARRGHVFQTAEYRDYFSKQVWYTPLKSIGTDDLNEVERYNVELIRYRERMNQKVYEYGSLQGNPYAYGEKAYEDLNRDGKKDKIICKKKDDGFDIIVNGKEYHGTGFYNLTDTFAITDIDPSDRYKEIIISDVGPSSDNFSKYYYYDGEKIVFMGETGGLYNSGIRLMEAGKIAALARGQILQTWFLDKYYKLSITHTLEEIPQDIYNTDYEVFAKVSIRLYTDREKSGSFILDGGQIVNIAGTDNEKWCLLRTLKGEEGWLEVSDFCCVGDNKINAAEIFDGLCYAD